MSCSGMVTLYCMVHRVYICTAHHFLSHMRCPVVPKVPGFDHKCGDSPNTVMYGNRSAAPMPLPKQDHSSLIRRLVSMKNKERLPRWKEEKLPEVQFKEEP